MNSVLTPLLGEVSRLRLSSMQSFRILPIAKLQTSLSRGREPLQSSPANRRCYLLVTKGHCHSWQRCFCGKDNMIRGSLTSFGMTGFLGHEMGQKWRFADGMLAYITICFASRHFCPINLLLSCHPECQRGIPKSVCLPHKNKPAITYPSLLSYSVPSLFTATEDERAVKRNMGRLGV
jgi:hypothetical protein